ncbi:MAG: tetratricopeptide repeat protein [Anaerolineales bacterium]|jgi:soluble lytic murein transglycosylase
MFKKQLFATIMAILLTACSTSPTPFLPTVTSHPTLPPGVTPSATASPTVTPSPTPTPGVRLVTADQAFFDGDYINAQLQYQTALSNTNDPAIIAASLWGLGRVEYAAGNNGKALIDLTNLSTSYPGEPNAVRAYFLLGEIYMALERYPEAAQAYSTYLKLRPGVLDSFVQERRGDAYNSAGNFTEAISAYKTALAAPHIGDDTALQIKIAQAVASSGDSTTALSMYDSISKASSDADVKAQMDLFSGRIDLALGQPSQAYQFFLDAVNNYPTSPDSYSMLVALVNNDVPVDDLNRGLVDYSAGQYGYARDAFQRYIDTNPKNDGTAAFYNAMTFVQLGDYQQGLSELTNFINSYPSNKNWQTAWGEKADIQWSELGDYPAAAQTYLDYAKANPDILFAPQALEDAGRNYERANNLEQAARTWESIADTYPGSNLVPQVLFWAGIARYRAATYSQALVTFQRDLQLSTAPDDQARAYFWIGKTQQTLGDGASAQSAWQQATLLDPTDYYSLRSQDMLLKRPAFAPPPATNFNVDLSSERDQAEAWLRVTFNLPINTDLSTAGALLSDPRLVRGTELWNLGLQDEARLEFEDLRISIQNNPADTYRLANYMLTLGLYRPAITAMRQVLTLAGMNTQAQTLAAPAYFNHVRYGLYYQDLVMPVAQQAGFDPLFLFSVIREESLFEGFVQSDKGARGLMQIIPSTGQGISDNLGWPPNYTSDDLYRPLISIGLGASYLAQQRVNFNGDLFAALAAYNAGPSAAPIWSGLSGPDADLFLEVIRISQTSDYIRSIYEIYSMYRTLYGVVP